MSGLTPRQIFGAVGPCAGGHETCCASFVAAGERAAAPAAFIISLREKPYFMGRSSGCIGTEYCEVGMVHEIKHPARARPYPYYLKVISPASAQRIPLNLSPVSPQIAPWRYRRPCG